MKQTGKIKAISQPTAETYRDGSVHNSIYVQIQVGVKQQMVYDRYTGQQVTENIPDMIGYRFADQKAQEFMNAGWQVDDVVEVDYRHGVRNNYCYVVIDGMQLVKKATPVQGHLGQALAQQPVVAQVQAQQPAAAPYQAPQASQAQVAQGPVDDLPF